MHVLCDHQPHQNHQGPLLAAKHADSFGKHHQHHRFPGQSDLLYSTVLRGRWWWAVEKVVWDTWWFKNVVMILSTVTEFKLSKFCEWESGGVMIHPFIHPSPCVHQALRSSAMLAK
jgi:hypothetical protein